MKKRVNIIYKGRVHGVGFRATAERLAHFHKITGFVRNVPDGSVEVVAEGEEAEINSFLNSIAAEMQGHIHASSVNWMPPTGEFSNFGINYY